MHSSGQHHCVCARKGPICQQSFEPVEVKKLIPPDLSLGFKTNNFFLFIPPFSSDNYKYKNS